MPRHPFGSWKTARGRSASATAANVRPQLGLAPRSRRLCRDLAYHGNIRSHDEPGQLKRRALATGNLTIIRAAAAELARIGVAEAAAMLFVIEQAEPDRYEAAAGRWLARLCDERRARLAGIARIAAALTMLPTRTTDARLALAGECERAGLPRAARAFARPCPPSLQPPE